MKWWHFRVAVIIVAIALVCGQGRSEYLFKKDGSIIDGKITAETAKNVSIRKADGKSEQVNRADIMRILYTQLYMGLVYAQKSDGRGVVGYMVDEDQETYTFRKELYRPEEFTLRREQVLFIARRNPSSLQGIAETDRVKLSWHPPYNQVKGYNIYLKGPGEKEFRKADDTTDKSHVLKNLRSNKEYRIHVTSVAREGDESTPSNEIVVLTKNIHPGRPGRMTMKEERAGTPRIVTWEAASDPDGTISEYRVFRDTDAGNKKVATVAGLSFTIPTGIEPRDMYLAAVDDKGAESERVRFPMGGRKGIEISANPSAIYPMGGFSDLG